MSRQVWKIGFVNNACYHKSGHTCVVDKVFKLAHKNQTSCESSSWSSYTELKSELYDSMFGQLFLFTDIW